MGDQQNGGLRLDPEVLHDLPQFLARELIQRPNGSSSSSRVGSWMSARQSEDRCCMPPDNCQPKPARPQATGLIGPASRASGYIKAAWCRWQKSNSFFKQ
jgi:hypothetical protein